MTCYSCYSSNCDCPCETCQRKTEKTRGAPDAQRKAFEKWATSQDMSVRRYGGGVFNLDYLDGATDRAWEVWQAAASGHVVLLEALREIVKWCNGENQVDDGEDAEDALVYIEKLAEAAIKKVDAPTLSLEQIAGSVKDFTGGLSLREYLDEQSEDD